MKRLFICCCAASFAIVNLADENHVEVASGKSEEIFVFLEPEKSSFWHTATNSTLAIPVCFPEGASSAELSVKGIGFSRTYGDIVSGSVEVVLPEAVSPSSENVYEFTLAFDNGITNSVRLGLVQGLDEDGRGSTRCLIPEGSRKWNSVDRIAVMPIPYGMRSLKLDGVETDTGLGGAQGWYAIGSLAANVPLEAELAAKDGEAWKSFLLGKFSGFFLRVR